MAAESTNPEQQKIEDPAGMQFDLYLSASDLSELRMYTGAERASMEAFIRAAIGNHIFIRNAYLEGGEFYLGGNDDPETGKARFRRVRFN